MKKKIGLNDLKSLLEPEEQEQKPEVKEIVPTIPAVGVWIKKTFAGRTYSAKIASIKICEGGGQFIKFEEAFEPYKEKPEPIWDREIDGSKYTIISSSEGERLQSLAKEELARCEELTILLRRADAGMGGFGFSSENRGRSSDCNSGSSNDDRDGFLSPGYD